ncbi:ubiquinone anaerobic biosynthesis accessory factor UbiT [Chitinolyticbacter albus]|uniref:ubiquinone anaerobic biosynthesis accessory factor UbiT n=1 Tax=Chitinolyticbacter albus TaxID=2961951 RepID=UPI003571581B
MTRQPWMRLAALLPEAPPSHAAAAALNLARRRLWPEEPFDWLIGRRLRFEVAGPDRGVTLTFDGERFVASRDAADCRFIASLADYLHLARRSEDPDTLFFQRRLRIEGDVELGLQLKNLLDATDWHKLHPVIS